MMLAGVLAAAELSAAESLRTMEVAEVAALSPGEAGQGTPVTVRGAVTFVERELVFFQDDAAGTYFRRVDDAALAPGDVVEVTGKTGVGAYVPGIEAASSRVLRRGPLPAAVDATYEDLLSGRLHYRRVGVVGVVRAASALNASRSLLRLAVGSRVLDVWVEAPVDDKPMAIDSRVRVRGVAVGAINNRRQLLQPLVRALDWSEVEVLQPGVPDEAVPRTDVADLLTYGGAPRAGGRVRVIGTVAASFARGMIYLRTDTAALGVRLAQPVPVQLGDTVEVLGFPEMGRFTASLVDASLVERRPGAAPEPIKPEIEKLFQGRFDSDLVQVTARVADSYRAAREAILVLQEKERRVQVALPDPIPVPVVGSVVQVTGIARVNVTEGVGYHSLPEVIGMYVRTPGDLVVLKRPSGWTVRRLALISSGLAGVFLLAVLWIGLLRRQVRRQAEVARRRIETEVALEERNRLARDFHDTLEQELVGLGLRLDAISTRDLDERRRGLVDASRDLVSRIQAETRNLVGDLRDPRGRLDDLRVALEELLEVDAAEGGPALTLQMPEGLPLLPAVVVHNLRMIARESITNALKHARASRITAELRSEPEALVLTIADDGCGFDAARETGGKRGHYGCVGIRERCQKIGAAVSWRSAPGSGTQVEVRLPRNEASASAGSHARRGRQPERERVGAH